jgi:hypothetical protein
MKSEKLKMTKLLFFFQRDLLPGISGEILEAKNSREKVTLAPISMKMKWLAWWFLGVLNASMLFYIFLFAVSQDSHRQSAWGRSLAIYLVLDIVILSTLTVLLMHVMLPWLILGDVKKIKRRLVESVQRYYEQIEVEKRRSMQKRKRQGKGKKELKSEDDQEGVAVTGKSFNAAKYLFLSVRLASEYRNLPVSPILLQFVSPWPKQSYQHQLDMKKNYSSSWSRAISRSVTIILMFFLTNLLASPQAIQDMIVQMALTVAAGYTVLIHMQLYQIYPLLVLLPTIFVLVVAHFIRQALREDKDRVGAAGKARRRQEPLVWAKETGGAAVDEEAGSSEDDEISEGSGEEGEGENKNQRDAAAPLTTRRASLQFGVQLAERMREKMRSTGEGSPVSPRHVAPSLLAKTEADREEEEEEDEEDWEDDEEDFDFLDQSSTRGDEEEDEQDRGARRRSSTGSYPSFAIDIRPPLPIRDSDEEEEEQKGRGSQSDSLSLSDGSLSSVFSSETEDR